MGDYALADVEARYICAEGNDCPGDVSAKDIGILKRNVGRVLHLDCCELFAVEGVWEGDGRLTTWSVGFTAA